jgi:hypothetical protein
MKAELTLRLANRQSEIESLADQRKFVDGELAARKSEIGETRRQLEQVRAELSRLKARKDSLEEILNHRAYTTESVKRLFTAIERGKANDLKPAGVLADFVEVQPAFEKATEEFLRDELEYVVVKNWQQAEQGIDLMRSDFDGRATFLVHPEDNDLYASAPPVEPAIGPETGIIGRLSDAARRWYTLDELKSFFTRAGNPRVHLRPNALADAAPFRFQSKESRILRALDGPALPVDELISEMGDDEDTLRALLTVLFTTFQAGLLAHVTRLSPGF